MAKASQFAFALFLAVIAAIVMVEAMPQGPPPPPQNGGNSSEVEDAASGELMNDTSHEKPMADDPHHHESGEDMEDHDHMNKTMDLPGMDKMPKNMTNMTGKPMPPKRPMEGGFNNARETVNKMDVNKTIREVFSKLPKSINTTRLQRLPEELRRNADVLVKRFGGAIQMTSLQNAMTSLPPNLLTSVMQGNLNTIPTLDFSKMKDILPNLQSSLLCTLNDTQKDAAIEAATDCSTPMNDTVLKQKLPDLGGMLQGMSEKCGYKMSNTSFLKVAKCLNQMSTQTGGKELQQSMRGLLEHLPSNLSGVNKDMMNAVGIKTILSSLPVTELSRMPQIRDDLLTNAKAQLEMLKDSRNTSDIKRYQAIVSSLTEEVRGKPNTWNTSTLQQELPTLSTMAAEKLRNLNSSAVGANLQSIQSLVRDGKLSKDQRSALAESWSKGLNASGMASGALGDLLSNLDPGFLCNIPDDKFTELKAAAANKTLGNRLRSAMASNEDCSKRRSDELEMACKNKTNTAAFEGLLKTNDEATRNKSCAAFGSFQDFREQMAQALNKSTPQELAELAKTMPDNRRDILAGRFVDSVRKGGKLDLSAVPDDFLDSIPAKDIESADIGSFCQKGEIWLNKTNDMEPTQRNAVLRKLTANCTSGVGDILKNGATSASIRAAISTADVKSAMKSGKLSGAELKTVTKDLPCGSVLRRMYMETVFGNSAQVTSANIADDPRVACSMDCNHISSIGDTQILGFIKDVCATGQPMKLKTAGCLKDKLCRYVERYVSTTAGASTDDAKCMADMSAAAIEGLCFQVLAQFSDSSLRSLTGEKCLTAVRKVALATTELLIRYPYSRLNALATQGLSCLAATSGEITEAVVGEMNCLATYMNPSDIQRMTPAAAARSYDCFGKGIQTTAAGLPITPLISTDAANAMCTNVKKSDGEESTWGSTTFQKLGCVAKFCDVTKMDNIDELNCTRLPIPDYLADEASEIMALKASNLDPSRMFNEAAVDRKILEKKMALREARMRAEQEAAAAAAALVSTTTSTTTTTTSTSTTRPSTTRPSSTTPPTTTPPKATTLKSAAMIEETNSSSSGNTSAKLVAASGDDYEYEAEETAEPEVKSRPKRQSVVVPTCSQIEADGIGANGLTASQVEGMAPTDVYNCMGPLGAVPILLTSVAKAIFNKIKMYYTPSGQSPWARYVPPEAYWKLNYAATGIIPTDVTDMTLNLRTSDNRSVLAELSMLPPFSVGFGSEQVTAFADEIKKDTGSFAWLEAGDVQALGVFICGMQQADISSIPTASLTSSLSLLKNLPCGPQQLSAMIQNVRKSNNYMDISSWSSSTVRELGTLVDGLSATDYAKIPASAISGLTVQAVQALPADTIKAMSVDQIKALESTAAKSFTNEQKMAMTSVQRDAWVVAANFLRQTAAAGSVLALSGRTIAMALMAALVIPAMFAKGIRL